MVVVVVGTKPRAVGSQRFLGEQAASRGYPPQEEGAEKDDWFEQHACVGREISLSMSVPTQTYLCRHLMIGVTANKIEK